MESVEIISKGPAASAVPASLGVYVKSSKLVQGYPIYKKEKKGEEEKDHFLFVSCYGRWVVDDDLTDGGSDAILQNCVTNPTPKLPPRNDWLYRNFNGVSHLRRCKLPLAEDDTIKVAAKVDGQQSGNNPMERFMIKCGLEKHVPNFSKLGVTMEVLRSVHEGFAYYPQKEEQKNIFDDVDVSLDECLIMRKVMQEERDNVREVDDTKIDLLNDNLPCFPHTTAILDHGKPVTAVTFFGDVGYLFTGGVGGYVRLWNTSPSMPPPFTTTESMRSSFDPQFRIPPPFSVSPHSRKFYTPIIEYALGGSDSAFKRQSENPQEESIVTCIKQVRSNIPGLLVGGLFEGRKSIQCIMFNNKFPPTNQVFAEMGYYTRKCTGMALSQMWNTKNVYCCFETYGDSEKDKNVEIWNIEEGELVGLLEGHDDVVTVVDISADGTKLWTGSNDKTVRLWDLQTKTQLQKFDVDGEITGLACSPKEDLAVAATGDNNVNVVRAGSEEVAKVEMESTKMNQIHFSPSGAWFFSTGPGVSGAGCAAPAGPQLFNFHKEMKIMGSGTFKPLETSCGAFHPEGTFIAMGIWAENKNMVEILNCSEKKVVSGYDSDSD